MTQIKTPTQKIIEESTQPPLNCCFQLLTQKKTLTLTTLLSQHYAIKNYAGLLQSFQKSCHFHAAVTRGILELKHRLAADSLFKEKKKHCRTGTRGVCSSWDPSFPTPQNKARLSIKPYRGCDLYPVQKG